MRNKVLSYLIGFSSAIIALFCIFYLRNKFIAESIVVANKTTSPIFLVTIEDPLVTTLFKDNSLPQINSNKSEVFNYSPKSVGSKEISIQVRYGSRDKSSPQKWVNCFSPGSGTINIEVHLNEILCK